MANTYTQIHLQFVFAVKYRAAILDPAWDQRLRSYITAIIQNNQHKMLAINNVWDHIHIFIGFYTHQSTSEIMRIVKKSSSEWINDQHLTRHKFQWQEGYGAFSYSHSHIDRVVKYIHRQQIHHQRISFRKEYEGLLQKFNVNYNQQYIFQDPL